jgi:hypothetical protein
MKYKIGIIIVATLLFVSAIGCSSTIAATSTSSAPVSSLTTTVSQITSSTTTTSNDFNSVSSNATNGLSLSLSLDGTTYQPNQEISITVDEANTLPEINNVPVSNNRAYSGLQAAPCDYISPYGIAVFHGDYTSSNFSTGTPLTLYDPHVARSCPTIYGITSYSFEPSSDMAAVIENSDPSQSNSSQQMKYELTINGCWPDDNFSSNSQLTNFEPGVYTVFAGDEWGALVVVHFTVSNTTSSR